MPKVKLILLLAAISQFQWLALSVESQFKSPANAMCACSGEVLTYTCTVDGGRATIWGGSAFDCVGNEITLIHHNFTDGTSGECNDGAILGQSIGVDGMYYTSQLNVTVSPGLSDKIVTCSSDSSMYSDKNIGESQIKLAGRSAPDNIYLVDAQKEILIFLWTPVASNDCSGLKYNIISDCGNCTVTKMTEATCSDLQLTTDAHVCHFIVNSVTCNQAGDPSSPVSVTLKVPNVPQVKIIPIYSSSSQALGRLLIVTTVNQTEDFFTISSNIPGSPTSYIAHAFNLVSGIAFNSTINLSSCEKDSGCPIDLPSSYCPPMTLDIISVNVSAVNKLGEGPHSNPFMIECSNNFVKVVYKETISESTISCMFLNQSDTSEKTCCIAHQLCDQSGPENDKLCSKNFSHNVQLEVPGHSGQLNCYIITASNDTYTVKVDGHFIADFDKAGNDSITIDIKAVTISCSLLLGAGIIVIVINIIIYVIFKRSKRKFSYRRLISEDPVIQEQYLKHCNLPDAFTLHKVGSDCELKEYITETLDVEFRRGHTYYEFTNEVEDILDGQEVLLQDKDNPEEWFRFKDKPEILAANGQKLYGEGIVRSSFGEQYRVFVQSFGSGTRHLPGGSSILYNHSQVQVNPDVLPLVPVCSEYFVHKIIDSDKETTVHKLCSENGLDSEEIYIFVTVKNLRKRMRNQSPRDVILMNRETKELFTGPEARQTQVRDDKWKVFVLEKKKQDLVLKKGSEVLYQNSTCINGNYTVVEVDKDCVRMSKFIETSLNCEFEDRKAFYEAETTEDLLYYKKILRADEKKLNCQQLQLKSPIEYFYEIRGVPSNAVKLENLHNKSEKLFIQSTSQGSRCLKKGTRILYLTENIVSCDPDEANCASADAVLSEDEHHHIHEQT